MDIFLFEYINNFSLKIYIMDFIAVFLGKYLGYILIFLLLLYFLKGKKYLFFNAIISAVFSRFFITELIRLFYYKERPFVAYDFFPLIEHSPTNSFPSGHAAFFFALAMAVFLKDRKSGLFFLISAFLISISRVYAGVHYPSDIVFGAIIGILSAILIYKINLIELLKKIKSLL